MHLKTLFHCNFYAKSYEGGSIASMVAGDCVLKLSLLRLREIEALNAGMEGAAKEWCFSW